MPSGSLTDTSPDAESAQLALIRQASVARRVQLALSLSASVIALARGGLRHTDPELTDAAVAIRFARIHYGEDLAAALEGYLANETG